MKLIVDGDIVNVKCAMENGFNINSADEYGSTLLHGPCANHEEKTIELLFEREVDLTATDTEN